MTEYDPAHTPAPEAWLAMDESDRIALVEEYHRHHAIVLPQPRLHAAIHVVVENQIAVREGETLETLDRLQAGGLTRHDAVHAIGMVVAEHLGDVIAKRLPPDVDPNILYRDRLRQITVEGWQQSGSGSIGS